ncbi:hypothetical protein A616_17210 [Brevibacillus brevis X23]|nr:hypothetical protein A616_17210 [Brevibacillus brevis X23]
MFKVTCKKCSGTGVINCYRHQDNGVCYDCMGKGFEMRKTKPTEKYWFQVTAIEQETMQRVNAIRVEATSEKTATTKARKSLSPDPKFGYDLESIQVERVEL